MPVDHVLVSTQIRCESGPTIVGDADSDPELMKYLSAKHVSRLGNQFTEYITDLTPREVLNRLSKRGYAVLGTTGVGQTCIWTLGKDMAPRSEIIAKKFPTPEAKVLDR
ncbi:GTP cyclohydrolase 1 feedback regulatory protein-like protein [Aphelenchoides avenae]|nr:GTP cyclohydrolase 1 feedback regulatory protein-like protein [Aphelenchus avenae]